MSDDSPNPSPHAPPNPPPIPPPIPEPYGYERQPRSLLEIWHTLHWRSVADVVALLIVLAFAGYSILLAAHAIFNVGAPLITPLLPENSGGSVFDPQ